VFSFGVYYLNIYLFARNPKIYKITSKMLLEDKKRKKQMEIKTKNWKSEEQKDN